MSAMAGATSYEQSDSVDSDALGYDPNYVPDSVKFFVVHMYRHIREKNVYEIHQMYENSFQIQSISDRFYKDSPWPSVDAVAPYVYNDHVFCLLYREMWFCHLYARLSPTLKQRIDSWDNYCSLFQVVLHGVVNMQLPNQWLWDMVDEFVYQFQSFCQYRAKMKNKTEQEISLLRQHRFDDEGFALYDELFSYTCPKFITSSAPSYKDPLVNYNQDAYRLQLKLFLYEVKQQQLLSGVRTFFKVYSTISLGKLATYMDIDEPTLRTILITYKHKTHSVDFDGKVLSNADVDFYIDDDTVHVVESKPAKCYGDYFMRQIVKLEGLMNDIDRIKLE
ncbi:uncharacterized protein [Henckelia pumila]|uniref:uncharacterized protein n=1 Tax=Henckelia pumila TaxID=405737 RepID=UPI003C6E7BA4